MVSYWGDADILELGSADGYETAEMLKPLFKGIHFVVSRKINILQEYLLLERLTHN